MPWFSSVHWDFSLLSQTNKTQCPAQIPDPAGHSPIIQHASQERRVNRVHLAEQTQHVHSASLSFWLSDCLFVLSAFSNLLWLSNLIAFQFFWMFPSLAQQTYCIITSFSTTSWCSGNKAVMRGHIISVLLVIALFAFPHSWSYLKKHTFFPMFIHSYPWVVFVKANFI